MQFFSPLFLRNKHCPKKILTVTMKQSESQQVFSTVLNPVFPVSGCLVVRSHKYQIPCIIHVKLCYIVKLRGYESLFMHFLLSNGRQHEQIILSCNLERMAARMKSEHTENRVTLYLVWFSENRSSVCYLSCVQHDHAAMQMQQMKCWA
jgi:hypothetical protein